MTFALNFFMSILSIETNFFFLLISSTECHKYKKPKRPCVFCEQLHCNLTLHIQRRHKNDQRVKEIMKLEKKARVAAFDKLRKEGIFNYNKKTLGLGGSNLMRERKQGESRGLKVCGNCHGFFSKDRIYAHRKKCCSNGERSYDLQFPTSNISEISEDFKECIVSKFRPDAVGKICKTDLAVLLHGDRQWAQRQRKSKNKKSVMTDMRLLGNMIYRMQLRTGIDFKGEDLLKRKHFEDLKK